MTTTTDTATTVLTADDVKALRKAETVIFRLRQGRYTIEAGIGKALSDNRPYTDVQRRLFPDRAYGSSDRDRTLTVSGYICSYAGRPTSEDSNCFAMIFNANYAETWKTIAGLLRAGDELSLTFKGDAHTNEALRKVGMHGDVLVLNVHRTDGSTMTFEVAHSTGPDNTARMVQA